MRSSRRPKQFLILAIDIGFLYLALFLALLARKGNVPSLGSWEAHARAFAGIFAVWIAVFYTAGLYNLDNEFIGLPFAKRLFWSASIGTFAAVVYFYLASTDIEPKVTLAMTSAFGYALIWGWRRAFAGLTRALTPRRALAFVGNDPIVAEIVKTLRTRPQLGYEARAIYEENGHGAAIEGVPIYKDGESFLWNAVDEDIRLFVIADGQSLSEQVRVSLFNLIGVPARFMRLPDFYEALFRRVPVGSINDLWFLENIDLRSKHPYEVLKRGIDIVVALAGLLVAAPFFPFIALAIRVESPGPIFFRQVRLGKGGKPFPIVKFRTMRTEGNDFSPTARSDSRITPFGGFLRRSRLDELPQMLNILKGDMSFVGPRPERPELVEELKARIPFYMQRLLVKPGVTGWDQVSGEYHSPSVDDTYKKLQYDLYYIKNLSPLLDASIFFKTILTVITRTGR